MKLKFEPDLLERFRHKPLVLNSGVVITKLPKGIFTVNSDKTRVEKNLYVVKYRGFWHLVESEIYNQGIYVKGLLRADFYECLDIEGRYFLLLNTYPLSCNSTEWKASVIQVVGLARTNWVSMIRIDGEDGYEAIIEDDYDYEEDTPSWNKHSMMKFIVKAFGDCVITIDNIPNDLINMGVKKRKIRPYIEEE